jgi:Protein of unknown function (DUF1579)
VQPRADADRLLAVMTRLSGMSFAALFLLCGACETGGSRRPAVSGPVADSSLPPAPLAEQVKKLSVATAPGPRHTALSPLEGEWSVVLSDVSTTGGETDAYRGQATLGWTLGGRFLRWDAAIDFGGASGKTTGFLGFDSLFGEYELMMISDLSQGMEVARGTGDLQGSGILFTLDQLDPRTAAHVRARSRLRLIDHDQFVLEQLGAGQDGEERVVRVSHYRRASAGDRKL